MVDHRVHVAGADGEKESRSSETTPVVARAPVRLGHDADAEPRRLQHPAEDGHGEAGVIDVRVAGDEHDVGLVPAAGLHLARRHRERRFGSRWSEPFHAHVSKADEPAVVLKSDGPRRVAPIVEIVHELPVEAHGNARALGFDLVLVPLLAGDGGSSGGEKWMIAPVRLSGFSLVS